jgi:hypothetical protein
MDLTLIPTCECIQDKPYPRKEERGAGVQDDRQEEWQTHKRQVGVTAAQPKKIKKVSV